MTMGRISNISSLLLLLAVACGSGNGAGTAKVADAEGVCDGKERPQLDCTSEFAYDQTKIGGGFSVFGVGSLNAGTEQAALRQIDQEVERYVAQARRLCDEYNKCVIDRDTYSTRSENMRRRMERVPALYDELQTASGDEQKRRVLAKAYSEVVPDDHRVELSLSLSVLAKKPDQSDLVPIAEGASLPSGTRVAFALEVSRPAHVYLFQKSPSGEINVLFPDPRITVKNPVPAGQPLRIPQGGASFKLDEKDVGQERVFVVASLEPVNALSQAVAGLQGGGPPPAPLAKLSELEEKPSPHCTTRALSFEEEPLPGGCSRERGLVFEDEPGSAGAPPVSVKARTEAADSLIARVFGFQHAP